MRIIGGRLKGKIIDPPAGFKARPTTDFAREVWTFLIFQMWYETYLT